MSPRSNARREADHAADPKPTPGSNVSVCRTCGSACFRAFGLGNRTWHHGMPSSVALMHPDATVVMPGGHVTHYPNSEYRGFTLCGFNWRARGGRQYRISDGVRLDGVCARCCRLKGASSSSSTSLIPRRVG